MLILCRLENVEWKLEAIGSRFRYSINCRLIVHLESDFFKDASFDISRVCSIALFVISEVASNVDIHIFYLIKSQLDVLPP